MPRLEELHAGEAADLKGRLLEVRLSGKAASTLAVQGPVAVPPQLCKPHVELLRRTSLCQPGAPTRHAASLPVWSE